MEYELYYDDIHEIQLFFINESFEYFCVPIHRNEVIVSNYCGDHAAETLT